MGDEKMKCKDGWRYVDGKCVKSNLKYGVLFLIMSLTILSFFLFVFVPSWDMYNPDLNPEDYPIVDVFPNTATVFPRIALMLAIPLIILGIIHYKWKDNEMTKYGLMGFVMGIIFLILWVAFIEEIFFPENMRI